MIHLLAFRIVPPWDDFMERMSSALSRMLRTFKTLPNRTKNHLIDSEVFWELATWGIFSLLMCIAWLVMGFIVALIPCSSLMVSEYFKASIVVWTFLPILIYLFTIREFCEDIRKKHRSHEERIIELKNLYSYYTPYNIYPNPLQGSELFLQVVALGSSVNGD